MAEEKSKNEAFGVTLLKSLISNVLNWATIGILVWLVAYVGGQYDSVTCAFKPWLGLPGCGGF